MINEELGIATGCRLGMSDVVGTKDKKQQVRLQALCGVPDGTLDFRLDILAIPLPRTSHRAQPSLFSRDYSIVFSLKPYKCSDFGLPLTPKEASGDLMSVA